MDEKRNIEEDLKPNADDYINTGTKAGLTTIPVIGGIAAEYFSMLVPPAIQKRRDEWLTEIYYRLKALEDKFEGFKVENLAKNDLFINTLIQTTEIALKTSDKEKIECLKNAVINSSGITNIEESEQMIFLNCIARYSPLHLKLLHFLTDPQRYGNSRGITYPQWSMGGLGTVIEFTFPELKNRQDLYDQIVEQMISDGLLQKGMYLHAMMTQNGMFASRTTELGKRFLNFISTFPTADGNK
jgi:hypothetical protein